MHGGGSHWLFSSIFILPPARLGSPSARKARMNSRMSSEPSPSVSNCLKTFDMSHREWRATDASQSALSNFQPLSRRS